MTSSSQLLLTPQDSNQFWNVRIVAETGIDTIANAADIALEEIKDEHVESNPSFRYRRETLARSYILDTVRAIHDLAFSGTSQSAMAFLEAFKRRLDMALRNSPHYRILEESPNEWWNQPKAVPYSSQKDIKSINFSAPKLSAPSSPKKPDQDSDLRKVMLVEPQAVGLRVAGRTGSPSQEQNALGRLSGWVWLGIATLFVLVLVLAKLLSRKPNLSLEAKQAIARQHVLRYSHENVNAIGQHDTALGTEFAFQAKGQRFTVSVDKNGEITSWTMQ
jgi:hypothetical protein